MNDSDLEAIQASISDGKDKMLDAAKILYRCVAEQRAKGANVSDELKKVTEAETLLSKKEPGQEEIIKARANIASVLGNLQFMEKTLVQSKSIRGGLGVLIFLSAVTVAMFVVVIVPEMFGLEYINRESKILFVPVYVYAWGIVGALSYLLWACITHIAKKDFDNYYIPWFFLRIPLGAILAAAIYFVVIAGFITLDTDTIPDKIGPFVVLAFVSGFSIRYSMNTIDRVIGAMMPNKQDVKENGSPPKEIR